MSNLHEQLDVLQRLCIDIRTVLEKDIEKVTFRAPIIDWHHPNDYRQQGVQGLRKFLGHAENERDHLQGLGKSTVAPKEITTNAPHILAVWDEFIRARGPLCLISQSVDCGPAGQAKIDIIADGGNQWIKVNTIKANRLMNEFREQDSYINSDFESDEDAPSSGGPVANGNGTVSPTALTNSIIRQARSLQLAIASLPRAANMPVPRLTYVLNRMKEHDDPDLYEDSRIPATFKVLRDRGVDLRIGPSPAPPVQHLPPLPLVPTRKIVLDLSVLVALCCDTTHQPLPKDDHELERRFRPMLAQDLPSQAKPTTSICEVPSAPDTAHGLSTHTNLTSDLRDQLRWERQHPLIEEMLERLTPVTKASDEELEFWVIPEVRQRLPGIVDIIGGEEEKRRAKALFEPRAGGITRNDDFWAGSRYEGREGVLSNIHVRVFEAGQDSDRDPAKSVRDVFHVSVIHACQMMLKLVDKAQCAPSPSSSTSSNSRGRRKPKGKKPARPSATLTPGKLPTGHTLHTLLAGSRRGWTVLTNNRGAVGKICREIGVADGLPKNVRTTELEDNLRAEEAAAIWVVNPSSLSEWRRKEVEQQNAAVIAQRGAALQDFETPCGNAHSTKHY